MQNRSRIALITSSAALSIAMLAGCSSAASTDDTAPELQAETQTVAEACAALEAPLLQIGNDITEANTIALEDPAALVPAFEQATADMVAVSADIDNREVAEVFDSAIAALVAVTEQYSIVLEDPLHAESEEFTTAFEGLMSTFSAIDTVCTG